MSRTLSSYEIRARFFVCWSLRIIAAVSACGLLPCLIALALVASSVQTMMPAVFVNHGGGPLPLLNQQSDLSKHLKELGASLPKPKAIVIVSAHWESDPIAITSNPRPAMLYDYGGFPPETYQYQYPAPGDPALAERIRSLLQGGGVDAKLDAKRGFDHGVFVPLMLMYPAAEVPVVCVSVHSSLSAEVSIKVGELLGTLCNEGVLLLGSGYTFHNMGAFFSHSAAAMTAATSFNAWLQTTVLQPQDAQDCRSKLVAWKRAPGATTCHPREEHLLPLFSVVGAGLANRARPRLIYTSSDPKSYPVSGFQFETSAASTEL